MRRHVGAAPTPRYSLVWTDEQTAVPAYSPFSGEIGFLHREIDDRPPIAISGRNTTATEQEPEPEAFQLEGFEGLEDVAVEKTLERMPWLRTKLAELRPEVERVFGPGVVARVEAVEDIDGEQVFVRIPCELSPSEALAKLDQLTPIRRTYTRIERRVLFWDVELT